MQNMFVTCTHVKIIIFLYLMYLSGCYIKDGQEKHRPILFTWHALRTLLKVFIIK